MVATRGTDQTVAFITGSSRIDPSTIRVEQWVEIIRAAIDVIPMNYLHGLQSVRQILEHGEAQYNGHGAELRQVSKALPSIPITTLDKSRKLLRHNEVFLHCAEVGSFPRGQYSSDRWVNAKLGAVGDKVPVLPISNYLLSRQKSLYYMLTEWQPHEEWDERSMRSTPIKFWYEPKVTIFEELDDQHLDAYLANGPERGVAKRMLHRIHQALSMTAGDIRGQYDHMREKQHAIGNYLDNMGELVC
jgi:hypothetical protein